MPASLLGREIFGNVSRASQAVFYGLALVALAVLVAGVRRRAKLWRRGRAVGPGPDWRRVGANVYRLVLRQDRVRGRGLASTAHALLFGGFAILFIGTILIAIEHTLAELLGREPGNPVFHKGVYYAAFEVVLDAAGLAFLSGCAYFLVRRLNPPRALGRDRRVTVLLGLLLAIGATGYVVEGLRILHARTPLPGFSFVGYLTALPLGAVVRTTGASAAWHAAAWWLHAALCLGLVAVFPWSRLRHAVAGTVRLASGIEPLGVLSPVSLEQVEETGEIGVSAIEQFTRRQLVELDACVSCGRCDEQCPALEAGKPLSPRRVVQDLLIRLERGEDAGPDPPPAPSLVGGVIVEETLWSCTTCSACVDVCPLGISPLGFLLEMRRGAVAEGKLRGAPASALQKLGRSGNPWGLPARDRMAWADGLDVPTVAKVPDFEVLYWVGCAASYDRRLQRIARSVVALLRAAGVRFVVLGDRERCTGDAARRIGDELMFQQLAGENQATFESIGVSRGERRIISHCPHCVNSLRQDYAQLGASLKVVHHSEYLAELVRNGRLDVARSVVPAQSVTYHDPCYLARVAGVTEAPRRLIEQAAPGSLVEMPRHGRQTSCCGAGGGRIWFDDPAGTRIGRQRMAEAEATGAGTLAVSCPFCLVMASDELAARGGSMEVRDIAEILAGSLSRPDGRSGQQGPPDGAARAPAEID
jgi:Fe-S oxidoreductase/nitrate reductase gamma subunit